MKIQRLLPAEKLDWLQLTRSGNIGPRNFQMLLSRFGSAAAALKALPELMRAGRLSHVVVAPRDEIIREMEEASRQGIEFIGLNEPDYPAALREIDSAPPILSFRGNLAALKMHSVSIVGSRNASAAGLVLTERLARGLGEAGLCVTSGLARGIDAKAHRACLKTGTIAVLAGGQNRIYPAEHTRLAEDICENGAILSEMPLNWEPRGQDFPRRNRIVAGLSLGTIVIEAAMRSGSLITARLANEQGRQVFAIPGSPLDPRAEGTNNLLKEGATLCTGADDIIDALEPVRRNGFVKQDLFREAPKPFLSAENSDTDSLDIADETAAVDENDIAARIKDLLSPAPVALDELLRSSGLQAAQVHVALLDLELSGDLQRHPNGMVSLT